LTDTKKSQIPPLRELAVAVSTLKAVGLKPQKERRKELEKVLQTSGRQKDLFPTVNEPCNGDGRINKHLGAGGVITPGRIQDPEGAKTMVISFKTAAGAILAAQRQTYKIVCFRDAISGILKVDQDATAGGKQNQALQGMRVLLIYKTHMHAEAALDPERCAFKTDANMRSKWLIKQIQ
jgi:hypothetical protein